MEGMQPFVAFPCKEVIMVEKTEAQKRAQKAYMDKFVRVEIRMTPERRSVVQAHAEAQGESTTAFINRAIDEAMQRDTAQK